MLDPPNTMYQLCEVCELGLNGQSIAMRRHDKIDRSGALSEAMRLTSTHE